MSEKLNKSAIDFLVSGDIDVKLTGWQILQEMLVNYPFSQKIAGFITTKANIENLTGVDNPVHSTFKLSNNPGIQYANLIRDMDESEEKHMKILSRDVEFAGQDNPDIMAEHKNIASLTQDKRKDLSSKKTEQKKTYSKVSYQSDFTRWLLAKSEKSLVQHQEPPKKINKVSDSKQNDPNQLKEEIISESLASLYVKQGLIKEAIEMYTKLSLKIPDKSTYFAGIIKKLNKSN